MSTSGQSLVSPAQYLDAERRATERHEYLAGTVFAMVGANRAHNLISLNIGAELRALLRRAPPFMA